MVRKSCWVVVSVVVMTFVGMGAASAAPPTMATSSWTADIHDDEIIGGKRTITVTNPTSETLTNHVIDITEVPCDCVVTDKAGAGDIRGGHWVLPDLAPGETVEVDLVYGPPVTTPVVTASATTETGILLLFAALISASFFIRRSSESTLQPA